ncbi:MAG: YdcF family protein [Bacillota bacterium]
MKILVILGSKLTNEDKLTKVGLLRTSAGAKIHTSINFDKILVTGGITHGRKISEAEVMEAELIKLGVDPEIIMMEARSRTTVENGKYCVEILQHIDGEKEVFVLSSKSHIARRFHNPVEIFDGYSSGVKNMSLVYVGV